MTTYRHLPLAFSHGQGAWLLDVNQNRYLDALAGIAVNALGHAHPALTTALKLQIDRLMHVSNIYQIPQQEKAADLIARFSGMDRVFFGNSGAEANEGLIKLSRLHARKKNIDNPVIVVMEDSFHGRTIATLSATGNMKVRAGFDPLLPGFIRVPFNDIEALHALGDNQNIVAILLETIQGEGGVHLASTDYLQAVRALCDQRDWLMMIDEIQTGMGRTGKWFGFQHANILPDAISLAKALGGGVPIGAFAARGAAADYLQPGLHGTTFGGNPLACTAAITVLETIDKEQLVERAKFAGKQLMEKLAKALQDIPHITQIRGLGLMIGIELDTECAQLVTFAAEERLLINVTAGNTIRLLPPLIINDEEIDLIVSRLTKAIQRFYHH